MINTFIITHNGKIIDTFIWLLDCSNGKPLIAELTEGNIFWNISEIRNAESFRAGLYAEN